MFPVDPDVPSITITDVTQTSVTVSWSVEPTNTVNATSVHYRATHTDSWNYTSVTGTLHTLTSLTPGTEYQFYVKITSYGKSASSQNTTATTGKIVACFGLLLEAVRKVTTIISRVAQKSNLLITGIIAITLSTHNQHS